MTENEIKNAIRTINAKLEEALEREKETEGTEDTVIWHMVGNDYKCAIKALEEIQQYREIEAEIKEQYHANVNIKKLIRCFIETIFKGEKHDGFCILTNEDSKMWEKYQAIGTVEELKRMKRYSALAKKHGTIGQVIDSCKEYEDIGTVEECREAREKQTPKKPIRIIVGAHDSTDGCPVCKKTFYEKVNFCSRCGNAIAWSE